MADDLPTEYEDIILGTGLQESILAAALARIGRRVLHFDRNNYYSGEWASFHLQGILEWIENYQTPADDAGLSDDAAATLQEDKRPSPDIEDGLKLLSIPNVPSAVYNLTTNRYVSDAILVEEEAKPTEGDSPQSADPVERTDSNQTVNQHGDSLENPEGNQQAGSQDSATSVETPENPEGNQQACESAASVEISADNSTELPLAGTDSPQPIINRTDCTDISQEPITQSSDTNSTTEDVPVGANADGMENQETEGMGHDDPSDPPDPPSVVDSGGEDHSGNAVGGDNSENGSAADATRRKIWTWQEIYDQWRKFNIDLAPKLMFCRGNMVDILVQSRISRYAEFKAVTRLLTSINDKLEHVPCSRSDVFSSRYVSMLEKRMLMKLIEFVLHYQDRTDDYEGFKDKPFSEFLQKRKLTPTLQHFVIHSIAMVTASTPTEEALQAMQFFLKSLGRYGNTAFLWTLYGSGELPQCFCRMAAVFGGIYMLRTTATSLILDSANVCKGMIDSEGRRLSCKNVIMDHSYATSKMDGPASFVSRAVLFTDRSLKESQQEEITFLTIPPPIAGEEPVRVLEIGSAACASPKGIFVVHLTRKCRTCDAQRDLMPFVKSLFQDLEGELDQSSEQPKVLWSLMFSYEDKSNLTIQELRKDQPDGIHVTGGPGCSVGYQHAVRQAKDIFEQICPGEEFLPPAPNPEDIIFEEPTGDNPGHGKKAGFEAESQEEKDQHEAIQSASGSLQETDQSGSSSLPGADQSESSSLPGAALTGGDQSGSISISGADDLTSKELKEESKNESQTEGKDHKSE